jgi:hypothetical protein
MRKASRIDEGRRYAGKVVIPTGFEPVASRLGI